MNLMEPLSEELLNYQYYVPLLDELIAENDPELKNRLQIADSYTQFINGQAGLLMNQTILHIKENSVPFPIASSIVIDQWKKRMFG